jgi:hypothetical protein
MTKKELLNLGNNIILDTQETFFRYKTIIFEEYEIGYSENKVPYITGKGKSKTELITVNDDDILLPLIELEGQYNEVFNEFADDYFEKYLAEEYDVTPEIMREMSEEEKTYIIDKAWDTFNGKEIDINGFVTNSILHDPDLHMYIVESFLPFFTKYGIPAKFIENDNKIVQYLPLFEKAKEFYSFCKKLENLENSHELIEIFGSKITVLLKDDGNPKIINYFDCPFEFTKYTLLLKDIIGTQKIIRCARCGSIMISRRIDKKYCSDSCRAASSRRRLQQNN